MGKILAAFCIVTFIVVGVFITRYRSQTLLCVKKFELNIIAVISQSHPVFSDNSYACSESYDVLSNWDICQQNIEQTVPTFIRAQATALATNISVIVQNQAKDIEFYKRDHDERCKDYSYLLFYPKINQ